MPSSLRPGKESALAWAYVVARNVLSYTGLLICQLPVQKSLSEGSILVNELTFSIITETALLFFAIYAEFITCSALSEGLRIWGFHYSPETRSSPLEFP